MEPRDHRSGHSTSDQIKKNILPKKRKRKARKEAEMPHTTGRRRNRKARPAQQGILPSARPNKEHRQARQRCRPNKEHCQARQRCRPNKEHRQARQRCRPNKEHRQARQRCRPTRNTAKRASAADPTRNTPALPTQHGTPPSAPALPTQQGTPPSALALPARNVQPNAGSRSAPVPSFSPGARRLRTVTGSSRAPVSWREYHEIPA
ncbi:hypothetical protein BC938DRAFT_472285 [Jimgerdemannia flammicorona]|uniref:Uncharacterized protein n=1 Tax=Jimgerdemannia flammicorona TaxID=994334 RepID=A0A433Q6G1_9FUNG|nr:hypothetical protein BC938DRAFT_472285 [Jimgerdemannia flammicorona]